VQALAQGQEQQRLEQEQGLAPVLAALRAQVLLRQVVAAQVVAAAAAVCTAS
jgi:hypothetical protein